MLIRGMGRGLSMGRGMGYGPAAFQAQLYGTGSYVPPAGAPPAAPVGPPVGAPPAAVGVSWFGSAASAAQAAARNALNLPAAAAGSALAVAQLLPLSGAYSTPPPYPPAPVPPPIIAGGGSLPSTGPAVPPTASTALVMGGALPANVAAQYGLSQQGPNVTTLLSTLQSAGYTTSDQMVAYLQSLDGQPLNNASMTEDQAAYYLGLIAKKQQEATYLKWGIVGAGVLGLALLLK